MLIDRYNKSDVNYDVSNDLKYPNSNSFNDTVLLENQEFERVVDNLNILFLDRFNRSLNTVESSILKGIWQRKTYSEIARESNYSSDYFTNVAAPKLLKQLSKLIGSRITKKSCRALVTKYITEVSFARTQNCSIKKNVASKDVLCIQKSGYKEQISFSDSSFLQDAICLAQMI